MEKLLYVKDENCENIWTVLSHTVTSLHCDVDMQQVELDCALLLLSSAPLPHSRDHTALYIAALATPPP